MRQAGTDAEQKSYHDGRLAGDAVDAVVAGREGPDRERAAEGRPSTAPASLEINP